MEHDQSGLPVRECLESAWREGEFPTAELADLGGVKGHESSGLMKW